MAGEDLNVIIGVFLDDQATSGLAALPAEVQSAVQRVNSELSTLGNVDSFNGTAASAAALQERLASITATSAEVTAQLLLAAEAGRGLNASGIQPRITGVAEARELLGLLQQEVQVRRELASTGLGAGVRRTEGGQLRTEVNGRDTRISEAENQRLLDISREELKVLRDQEQAFKNALTTLGAVRTESQAILSVQERIALLFTKRPENNAAQLIANSKGTASNSDVAAFSGVSESRVAEIRAEVAAIEAQRAAITGVTTALSEENATLAANKAAMNEAIAANRVAAAPSLGTTSEVAAKEAEATNLVAQARRTLLQINEQVIVGEEEVAAAQAKATNQLLKAAAIQADLTAARKASSAALAEDTAFEERAARVTELAAEQSGVLLRAKLALFAADERLARVTGNSASTAEQVAQAYRAQSAAADALTAATEKLAAAEKAQAETAKAAAAPAAAGGGGGFFGGLSEGLSGKGGFNPESAGRQIGEVAKYIYLYEAFIKLSDGVKEAIKNTEEFERSVTNLQTILGGTREEARATGEQLAAIGAVGGLRPDQSVGVGLQFARTFQGQAPQNDLLNQGAQLGTQLSVLTGQDASKQLQDATASVRGFNLSFGDTQRVIDAATFSAQAFGFANASDVLPGLGQIADIASAAGFSVEKTAALVADVRARTGETSEAAAGELRRVFGRQGNNAFQQVFTQFGIDRTQGFEKEIAQLAGVFDKLDTKQRASITAQFGGGRAGTAVTAFLEDFPKISDVASKSLDNAGISQKQFTERLNDVAGLIKTITGEFARLGVAIGESGIAAPIGVLLIGLKDVLLTANGLLTVFNAIPAPIRQAGFLVGELLLAGKALSALGIGQGAFGVGARRAAREAENAALTGFTSTGFASEEIKGQSKAVSEAITEAGTRLTVALDKVVAELAAAEGETTATLVAAREELSTALLGLNEQEAQRVIQERVAAANIAAGGAATAEALARAAAEISLAGQEIAGAGALGAGEGLLASSGALRRGAGRVAADGELLAASGGLKEASLGIASGLRGLLTSPLFLGIAGLTVGSAIIGTNSKKDAANQQLTSAQQLLGGGPGDNGGLTTAAGLDSALSGAGNAKQAVDEANKGVIASIENFFTGAGDASSKQAQNLIDLLKDQKKKIEESQRQLAGGANPSSIIDFSVEGGVKTGVQTLEQSGRSATTVFNSLIQGLAALNAGASAAANGGLNIVAGQLANAASQLSSSVAAAPADARTQFNKDLPKIPGVGQAPLLAGLDLTKFQSLLDTAFQKDLADLGIGPSGGTLSADQITTLKDKAVQDAIAATKALGHDITRDGPTAFADFKKAVEDRVDSTVKALQGITDAQKGLITPDNINQAITDLLKNAQASGVESGSSAAVAGTGGQSFTAAQQSLAFAQRGLAQVKAVQDAHPELVQDGQLEQAQTTVNNLTLAFTAQLQARIDLLAKLAESNLAPSDKIGRTALQIGAVTDKLKTETDPDKAAALQTSLNDLNHTQQQNAVDQANAVEKASIDPRDVVGVAQAAVDSALRQIRLLKSQGDTSSAAFFDALAQLQAGEVALANQRVSAANAAIEAGVTPGDALGEANAKVQEAINTLNATIAGTPGRLQAIRALADARQALIDAQVADANAQADAGVLPGDAFGQARTKLRDASRTLNAAIPGTTAYFVALKAYEDSLAAFANAQRDAARNSFLLRSGTFTDPLTQANADVQGALTKLNQDRAGQTITTPDRIVKGTPGTAAVAASQASIQRAAAAQAAVSSDNAQIASLRQQEADQLAFLRGTGTAANPQFGGAENYKLQKQAFDDAIAPLQAKLNADTAELVKAQQAAQGTAATAGTPDRVIKGITTTIHATAQQIQADLLALAQARQAAKDAAAALENAKLEAGATDVTSKVDAARRGVVEATNTLNADQKNTTKYFGDLANLHKAQEAYAQALRDAARVTDELSGDTTDPVFEAAVAFRAARAKLAADIARKASKDTLNTDKLDVEKTQQAAQRALFDQQFADNQTAFNLREESSQQYLAFLKGQDTSLRKQLAAMKKGSEGYRQLVDELNQVDQAIQAASSQLSGQFNLGDIKLPTVFEVRRSVAASANGQSVTSNNVQNIQTTINGADFARVVAYLNSIIGTSGQTVAPAGRKVA